MPEVRVTLFPKKPSKAMKRVINDIKRDMNRIYKKLEKDSLRLVRQLAPVRSGELRDSFRSRLKIDGNLNAVINVESPLPRAAWMNVGTAPSRGRYVPILQRRLVTERAGMGTHPGVTGTRYLDRAEIEMQERGEVQVRKIIKDAQKSFGRHFPKGRRR